MAWYPFQYNDLDGFKQWGLKGLGTSSNEAVKHFDAYITGVTFGYEDPSYSNASSIDSCLASDPSWLGPRIIQKNLSVMSMCFERRRSTLKPSIFRQRSTKT